MRRLDQRTASPQAARGGGAYHGRASAQSPQGETPSVRPHRVHRAHGANDHRVVRILRALLALPRVLKMYPSGHTRVVAQVTELRCQLVEYFEGRAEPLRFSVRGTKVELNGEPIGTAPDLTSDFAFKLRRRKMRSLALSPGIERAEIKLLAELFRVDSKELLRAGGAHAFLSREPHPHVEVSTFRGDGADDEDGEIARSSSLSDEARSRLGSIVRDESIAGRVHELRDALGDEGVRGVHESRDDLQNLVSGFLDRTEWESMDAEVMRLAFSSFLDVVAHTLGATADADPAVVRARIASLTSFFQGVGPDDLHSSLERAGATTSGPEVVYSTEEVRELLAAPENERAAVTQTIKAHLESHPHDENALLILCELMVTAATRDQYHERRHMFLNATSDDRYTSAAVARILRRIAVDLPQVKFETRDELVQAVFDNTKDEEALMLFLVSMTDRFDVVRPCLKKLAAGSDPFPLLMRLVEAPVLAPMRSSITTLLLEAARAKKQGLARWARKNRDLFFKPVVFEALFSQGTTLIGPIAKEILTEGTEQDRAALIERLKRSGSANALRLLVLGMPHGDEVCDPELVLALGAFSSPLAVGALRDVVHRNNIREFDQPEAAAAVKALLYCPAAEGRQFLKQIAKSRVGIFRQYCRELRSLVKQALDGNTINPEESQV